MKFLISNYSNPWNTESYYFNAGLNLIDTAKSEIFNTQQSVYDNFDRAKPDVFITHISQISKDIVYYLKTNKVQLVINTNGIPKENIDGIATSLLSENIAPSFFGCEDLKLDNAKYFKILPAADTFLNRSKREYAIDKLIFVSQKDEIVDLDGTYHYATINQNISKDADLFLPISALNNMFSSYNEIIFKGGFYIGSQISFNAIYSGTKVIFDTKNSSDLDKIDSIFKGQKLLSAVKNKHTGLHRLKSLLSQLSMTDLSSKLEDVIQSI